MASKEPTRRDETYKKKFAEFDASKLDNFLQILAAHKGNEGAFDNCIYIAIYNFANAFLALSTEMKSMLMEILSTEELMWMEEEERPLETIILSLPSQVKTKIDDKLIESLQELYLKGN